VVVSRITKKKRKKIFNTNLFEVFGTLFQFPCSSEKIDKAGQSAVMI